MGVCWGSGDLMNAIHKHLVQRGYKCEDLFRHWSDLSEETCGSLAHILHSMPT